MNTQIKTDKKNPRGTHIVLGYYGRHRLLRPATFTCGCWHRRFTRVRGLRAPHAADSKFSWVVCPRCKAPSQVDRKFLRSD